VEACPQLDGDGVHRPPFWELVVAASALAVAGFVVLVTLAATRGSASHVVGCAVFGATLLIYVASFRQAGLLKDWLDSAEIRARGNELPFSEILRHRRYWVEVMFTKPGILVGLLGALMALGGRRRSCVPQPSSAGATPSS